MITNLIDRRKRPYRWKRVDAIIEPTWPDNACADADQAEPDEREPIYDEKRGVSLADAVAWAGSVSVPVTLYLYDEGGNTAVRVNVQ